MRAKAYMMRYRREREHIDRLRDEIHQLKESMTAISIDMTAEKVQTSPQPDSIGREVARLADKEMELRKRIIHAAETMLEIDSTIDRVSCPEYQRVLHLRYIHRDTTTKKFMLWREIADEMNYTERGIEKLHERALREVEKLI